MRRKSAQVILTTVIIVLLALFVAVTLLATFLRLQYRYNLDYAESATFANAYYLWQGEGLYRDPSTPPYLIPAYAPIYYLLIAPFSSDFLRGVYTGRLISFACFIAIGAMVFSAVRRRTGGLAIPAISCGFLFSSYVFFVDSSLAQINLLGLCLSILGVWLLGERKSKALAFVVFLLAVYTKQTLVVGVCAASIWIGIVEKPSRGLAYFLLFCLVSGIVLAVINFVTGGLFFLSIVTYNVNPIVPKWGILAYIKFFCHYVVLIVIVLFGLSWRRPSVWQVYFVVGLLWAATAAKEGAGPIYFAPPLVGLLVVFGHALGRLRNTAGWGYGIILALIIAQIALMLPEGRRRLRGGLRLPGKERALEELSAIVRSADGPVLTESADLSLSNGKDYIYQGPDPRPWDEREGKYVAYKPPGLLKFIETGKFSLVAEYFIYRRDSELMKLIGEHYYKIDRTYPSPLRRHSYTVWLPRQEGD